MPEPIEPVIPTLASWLPRARWFAGKDAAAIGTISIHDRIGHAAGSLLLVDVAAGNAEQQRYAVPVDARSADAAAAPAFSGWLIDVVLRGLRVEADRGTLHGRLAGTTARGADQAPDRATAAPATDVPDSVTVRPLGHDASNTSLLVGINAGRPDLVVKLLRRCRPGIQPEEEIGEFFATHAAPSTHATDPAHASHAPWAGTPRLRGWLEYVPREQSAEPTVLATIHDAVPNCVSAWDRLGSLVATGALHGADRDRLLAIVASIGTISGEMHARLASRADIPAFAPEPATPAVRHAMTAAMTARLADVAGLARLHAGRHAEPTRGLLLRFAAREPEFADRLRAWATLPACPSLIRIHGDYHLGQVLLGAADDRPFIIDFEGEPGRPLADRRAKAPACRDIAGMCRSFDYLLRHAALHGAGPWRADDLRLLETTFLAAYETRVAGSCWWPADAAVAARLLDAFRLDKAIYELAYEIRNRPDWIAVPLAALDAS